LLQAYIYSLGGLYRCTAVARLLV